MSIIDRNLSHTWSLSGRLRIRCTYIFSDGRQVTRGPVNVDDQAAADALLIALEPGVLASMQLRDAQNAEINDLSIEGDAGESTMKQRARQYLKRAMAEDDTPTAFSKLEKFNTFRVNQGWSASQVKNQLDITDNQWDEMIARYSYLKSNEQTLIDYQAVVAGDTVRSE